MNNKKLWRRHKTEIILGTSIILALGLGYKDIARNMQNMAVAREEIASNNNKLSMLEEQREHEEKQAVIAEARYKKGCRVTVSVKDPRNLATLVEGEAVQDRTTKKPLPVGTVVCDGNGNTGVLLPNAEGVPVVQRMAFTGKRELVNDQIKKIHGARVYYVTPEK